MTDTGNYYVLNHLVLITGLTDRTLRSYIASGILQGESAGIIEQKVLGPDVALNYSLVRILILVAFCAAGFVIQLKTSKK